MPSQADRRAATRRRILDAGRRLLVEHGYEGFTTAQLLDEAGVSRGALYHHFPAKHDVVAAIYEQVSADTITSAARSTPAGAGPAEALLAGCLSWLDAASDPPTASILFEAGPAALGAARCAEIENALSLRVLRRSIQHAVDAGELRTESVDLAARFLNAVLAEAARVLVDARDDPDIGRQVHGAVRAHIAGLRPVG